MGETRSLQSWADPGGAVLWPWLSWGGLGGISGPSVCPLSGILAFLVYVL